MDSKPTERAVHPPNLQNTIALSPLRPTDQYSNRLPSSPLRNQGFIPVIRPAKGVA
jgi:hypothetical protein